MTTTTANSNKNRFQLCFTDLEDLTKRLVLLPRIEDEGVGAVIASYSPQEEASQPLTTSKKEESPEHDSSCLATASSDSTECRDEKEETVTAVKNSDGLVGCILVGTSSQSESLEHAEFSDILSAIRAEQEGPLVLHLEKPPAAAETSGLRLDKSSSSSEADGSGTDDLSTVSGNSIAKSEAATSSDQQHQQQPAAVPETITSPTTGTLLSGRLANWGSRVRVGAQFAAQAASTAAIQAANAAAEARQRAAVANSKTDSTDNQEKPVGLHVQTSLGAFLPLNSSSNNNNSNNTSSNSSPRGSSELNITSSSVLYIRKSAVEPCPPRGFSFQWYKGVPELTENSPLEEWTLLPGANMAAFQPSTTEAGYRLLCIVTMDKVSEEDDSDSDSDSDDEEHDNTAIIRCMTPHVVAADLSLFNGARQALVRGAHFGQLQGKGKAQGRTFRVQVEMGSLKKRVASAVKLDQVVDGTAEPLHDDVFHRVTAMACGAKGLALKFQPNQVADGASMVSALLNEDGALELVAPNRFARESLLLAIGIANFTGKPSELETTTILYRSEDGDGEESDSDDSASSISDDESKKSCVSNIASAGPQAVDKLSLSPARSERKEDDAGSVLSQSSAGKQSTIASSSCKTGGPAPVSATPQDVTTKSSEHEAELEKEIAFLRSKLAKKDKVVSELQREVTRSDAAVQQANQKAAEYQHQVKNVQAELQSCQNVYRAAQQAVEDQTATLKKFKAEQSEQVLKLKEQVESQSSTIAELEKTVKSHQNEKAVLTAAIEARESKLTKMAELQESYTCLSSKVSEQDQWRKELQEITERYNELKADLDKVTQREKECRSELEKKEQTIQSVNEELESQKDKSDTQEKELHTFQSKIQKLKSERNSYKQKADSLSKEVSRICRNGRTLADVERILANEATLKEEVELLRKQKRKALEECHSYRKSYEQNRAAQELIAASPNKSKSNPQHDAASIMERNIELERVVTELTEYVNAKEMQLETLMQVNKTLQEEIHGLAQANMNTNEV